MKLPKLAVQNYQFVLVVVIMALGLGIMSFINMPRSEDPVLNLPFFNIVAVYPGTSPNDMEQLIANKLEDEINEIEEIKELKTRITDGIMVMGIESNFNVDIDDKYNEIIRAVNTVQPDLPDGLLRLDVAQFSPLDVSILQLAFVSETASYTELQTWAERLEDKLKRLDGVRDVEVQAFPEEEVRVALDFEKMSNMNISLNQVVQIVQSNNANIPGGNIEVGSQSFSLKTSGNYKNLEEIKNTVITANDGKIVYLKDIASVYFEYKDDNYTARHNGQRAIYLSVTQKGGKNIIKITENMDKIIEAYKKKLPDSIMIYDAFKQGPAVDEKIQNFFVNLLQGIGLVGLLVLLFLGFRNAIIIMTVIPTSIVTAIFAIDSSGMGLQQVSIAGLVIALGLLVDNGIVVVENIARFIKEGKKPLEAAIAGTSEVGWAIVSSTATTILAFLPMMQLGGGTGEFVQSLPLIVIYSLLASLLLALALTPLLASKLLTAQTEVTRIQRYLQQAIQWGFSPVLRFALRFPVVILALSIGALVASFSLFEAVGVSFFPAADKPMILINIDAPDGSNLKKTDEAVRYVESFLDTMAYVESYSANIGHGNPQVYYNENSKSFDKAYAQLVVLSKPWKSKPFYAFLEQLRTEFDTYPSANIQVTELKNGPPSAAPIVVRIIGDELSELKRIAAKVEALMKNKKGLYNIENPLTLDKTNIKVAINKDKAGLLGIPIAEIDRTIRTAITGIPIGTFNDKDGKEYDIVTRMPFSETVSIEDFDKIYLTSVTGASIPLRQVASLEFESSPPSISHYNTERNTAILANVSDEYNVLALTNEIIEQLDTMNIPEGYRFNYGGEYANSQESFGNLGQLLIIAVLGILAVLILQFRSFVQPFIVLSAIPFALIGSIVALYLTGWSFSFFAFVGFTSLVGIVVNTSIILVDYTNQLMERGMSKLEAIQTATETRFTPILLTTLTTILGLLPLTLTNSGLWSPMGWTIIGGMISSTLLTLLIVPILYKWLTPNK